MVHHGVSHVKKLNNYVEKGLDYTFNDVSTNGQNFISQPSKFDVVAIKD